MMPPARRPASPNRSGRARTVLRGLFLLGTGRADGFDCFGNSRDAFLSALTPPLAFLVVFAVLLLAQKPSLAALCLLLLGLCGILLTPVLSHLMATVWKRSDRWLRYATASAWSVWLALPLYVPAILVMSFLATLGLDQRIVALSGPVLLGAYMLWLQWFLAWKGLRISGLRAALTVAVLTAGSVVIAVLLQPLAPLLVPPGQLAN